MQKPQSNAPALEHEGDEPGATVQSLRWLRLTLLFVSSRLLTLPLATVVFVAADAAAWQHLAVAVMATVADDAEEELACKPMLFHSMFAAPEKLIFSAFTSETCAATSLDFATLHAKPDRQPDGLLPSTSSFKSQASTSSIKLAAKFADSVVEVACQSGMPFAKLVAKARPEHMSAISFPGICFR